MRHRLLAGPMLLAAALSVAGCIVTPPPALPAPPAASPAAVPVAPQAAPMAPAPPAAPAGTPTPAPTQAPASPVPGAISRRDVAAWTQPQPAAVPDGFVGPAWEAMPVAGGAELYIQLLNHLGGYGDTIVRHPPGGHRNGSWTIEGFDQGDFAFWPTPGGLVTATVTDHPSTSIGFSTADQTTIARTTYAGGTDWRHVFDGQGYHFYPTPDGRHAWFDFYGQGWLAVAEDGTVTAKPDRAGGNLVGVRRDGALVAESGVYDAPGEVTVHAVDGRELARFVLAVPDYGFGPFLDGQDRVWWQGADGRIHRFGPTGQETGAWAVGPKPVGLVLRGGTAYAKLGGRLMAFTEAGQVVPAPFGAWPGWDAPDGTRWEGRTDREGPPRVVQLAADGAELGSFDVPGFEAARPIAAAGPGGVWVEAAIHGVRYYGPVGLGYPVRVKAGMPAAMPVPAGPVAPLDPVGRWTEVPEGFHPGPLSDEHEGHGGYSKDCTATSMRTLAIATDPEGMAGTYGYHAGYRVTQASGLVTVAPALTGEAPGLVLRHDPVTGHLVGRVDGGRPVRFARLPEGRRPCDEPWDK